MTNDQIYLIFYLFFCTIRIAPFRRRWRIPFIHGENWFMGVPVPPGFYSGEGRAILKRYRRRLILPFFVEAAAVAAILAAGRPVFLMYLVVTVVLLYTAYSVAIMRAAQKEARPFQVADVARPASAVALPLATRRLTDYANRKLDYALAFVMVASLAWIARFYSDAGQSFREFWSKPLLIVYLDIGILLAKRGLVVWRTAVPRDRAEEYLDWAERRRRFLLSYCDSFRVWLACALALCAVGLTFSDFWGDPVGRLIVVAVVLLAGTAMTIWLMRRIRKYLADAARLTPVRLPATIEPASGPGGRFCYRPAIPVMLVRGGGGYALNLASSRTQIAALYVAGLVALLTWMSPLLPG
ncbi:MAG TPA: hypothetical protein VGF59_30430 [Bryobacteraceae bacterium]|jgi:hypothetical protein